MEFLIDWDYALFSLIHEDMNNVILDMFMPTLRESSTWFPFYALLIVFIFYRLKWKNGAITIALLILTVGLCDFSSAQILKKTIERPRPCHSNAGYSQNVRSLINCGSGYSMPSAHATNHFGIAVFLMSCGLVEKRIWKYLLIFWASVICWGQIYVGVHYPSDILIGALLGSTIAYIVTRHILYRLV